MKYGVATLAATPHSQGEQLAGRRNYLMPIELFPGRWRGCSCSKNRRLRELHLSSTKQSRCGCASCALRLGSTMQKRGHGNRKHCTDCEHDLTSPIVNSTQHGSRHCARHGQVLCSQKWLYVSCAIQTVSDSNNTTNSSAALTRGLKSDELGQDPRSISASVTDPEDSSLRKPPPSQPES